MYLKRKYKLKNWYDFHARVITDFEFKEKAMPNFIAMNEITYLHLCYLDCISPRIERIINNKGKKEIKTVRYLEYMARLRQKDMKNSDNYFNHTQRVYCRITEKLKDREFLLIHGNKFRVKDNYHTLPISSIPVFDRALFRCDIREITKREWDKYKFVMN